MGFMMVALRQHLPRPFNSAMEVHCANYFQMVLLRRVFSSSLAQPTFPICPNKKPATSSKKEKIMKLSKISILSVPLLAAGAIALSGCGKSGNPTTISYRQIGICKSFVTAGTPQQPNADEGFAVFKVESIDNSKNGSAFYFDPVRFYVNQSTAETKGNIYKRDQRFMNADSRIGPALGVKYVDKITIP